MENCLVSVIMPAYNVEKYISRGIKSVIEQSYKNLELVIIDDGSSDSTLQISRAYALEDNRIKVFTQNNKGVSSARNKALDIVEGDYILFLDSDDWLELDAIEKLMYYQIKNEDRLVCCDRFFAIIENDIIKVVDQTKTKKNEIIDKISALKEIGTGKYNLQSSCYKLFKNNVIRDNNLKFNENIYYGEDGLFTYQYLNKLNGLIYVPQPLFVILNRPNSATTGTFNHKWLSSIESVKIMINECEYSEIEYTLKRFLYVKSVLCMKLYLKSSYKSSEDFKFLKNSIIENKFIKKSNLTRKIKEYMIFYMFKFLPEDILKFLIKLVR